MTTRVLLVDDDPLGLELLGRHLAARGYAVVKAAGGAQAMEVMRKPNPPQLVISDWIMPGMDGPALARAIRAERSLPFVYFIILTVHSDGDGRVMEALSAGADDFMSKPARPAELAARLRLGQRIIDLESEVEHLHAEHAARCAHGGAIARAG